MRAMAFDTEWEDRWVDCSRLNETKKTSQTNECVSVNEILDFLKSAIKNFH